MNGHRLIADKNMPPIVAHLKAYYEELDTEPSVTMSDQLAFSRDINRILVRNGLNPATDIAQRLAFGVRVMVSPPANGSDGIFGLINLLTDRERAVDPAATLQKTREAYLQLPYMTSYSPAEHQQWTAEAHERADAIIVLADFLIAYSQIE